MSQPPIMLRQAFETAVGNFPQYYVGLSYSAGSLSQYCTGIFTAPEVCRSIAPVFLQRRKSAAVLHRYFYSAGSLPQYCTGISTVPEVCRSIAPVFSQYRKSFHKKTRMHLLSGAVGSPFIQ